MSTQKVIPGPSGFRTLQTLLNYTRDPLQTFDDLRTKYGDIFQIKFWKHQIIHLTHPDNIQLVLQNSHYEVTTALSSSDPVVGKGLSTNTGESWLRQRRMIQPAFHHEKISQYLENIAGETEKMLTRWEAYASQQTIFDLSKELLALNHAQLYHVLFGDEVSPKNQEVLEALRLVRMYSGRKNTTLISTPQTWNTPTNRQFWNAVKLLDQFMYGLIEQRKKIVGEGNDLLTFLIHACERNTGQRMADQQLHDEMMTMFFAAYEDAANALCWAFYQLSRNPPVQERLDKEVDEVLAQDTLDFKTLQKLTYGAQIIDETLRLYPPTWSLLRDVRQDEQIHGYHIPKGAILLINIFLLHRHPHYWKEPERFDPERFSAEKAALTRKAHYIPFGSGSRKCIGYSLALTQMRANLALISKKYRITPQVLEDVKMETDSSLRMKGGFPVMISLRNSSC
ncbi:MAG: cytochrome P450 [Anaerolineales bacterium]